MNPSDQARQIGVIDSWLADYTTAAVASNPTAGTIIGDTGGLAAGYYDVYATLSIQQTTPSGNLYYSWRNAANSSDIHTIPIFCSLVAMLCIELKNCKVAASERFRFSVISDITGLVGTSIRVVRRA